jgi:methylenetetrahydrofolate dehydrogenase (NADP+) / methenyltetrahydrofolate cyclohydrolase
MTLLLDGRTVAMNGETLLRERVTKIIERSNGVVPTLATILVGDNSASATYVRMKRNACERVGMNSKAIVLPKDTSTYQLVDYINELNQDPSVHGILLQHPVPQHINERVAFDTINLKKDVDGVTCLGFGKMTMGESVFGSATPAGIIKLLNYYKIELSGKHAVVIGRSAILGKPMAMMLLLANATVTICHSKTNNLKNLIKDANIVVGAVGKPNFIKAEWIKSGAVIIDAGYNKGGVGDIEITQDLITRCNAYTPVPGGVGPMTIYTLITQCVESAEAELSIY